MPPVDKFRIGCRVSVGVVYYIHMHDRVEAQHAVRAGGVVYCLHIVQFDCISPMNVKGFDLVSVIIWPLFIQFSAKIANFVFPSKIWHILRFRSFFV